MDTVTDRMKQPMKDFVLSAAIEIKEKEAEFMKVVQRLRQLGVDYDLPPIGAMPSRGVTPNFASGGDLPAARPTTDQLLKEDMIEAVAATKEATSTMSPKLLDPYGLPPEPRFEDLGLSEETLKLISLREMGLPLPTPSSFRRASCSPLRSLTIKEHQCPNANSRDTLLLDVSPNYSLATSPSFSQARYVNTPDLFKTSQLMAPQKSKIPAQTTRRIGGHIKDFKQTTVQKCPRQTLRYANGAGDPDLTFIKGGRRCVRSPVTPTLSTNYLFAKPDHQIAGTAAVERSATEDTSPLEPELMTVPKSRRKVTKWSPISPELTWSLNWVKLK